MQNSIDDVLDQMDRFGGSFVKGLAELYRIADAKNRKRLDQSFKYYFEDYDKWASRSKKKGK